LDDARRLVTQDDEIICAVAESGPVRIFIHHDVERNPPPEAALRGVGVIRMLTSALRSMGQITSLTGPACGNVGDPRTEQNYVSFLENLFASTSATTQWRVVCRGPFWTAP
jgi:hypothetical protein